MASYDLSPEATDVVTVDQIVARFRGEYGYHFDGKTVHAMNRDFQYLATEWIAQETRKAAPKAEPQTRTRYSSLYGYGTYTTSMPGATQYGNAQIWDNA
ncbi:hypothetical protein NCPPB3778_46 [Rathayibacter phage NCPPB3778]|nr:hypothetical protein NCPPB3778_46 [Rathayibacter phage NCPPB3778]